LWLRARLWPDKVRREIEDEIAEHIELRARELEAKGLSRPEAWRLAGRRLGDIDRIREHCRELYFVPHGPKGEGAMSELIQDFRYAVRGLRRAPGFAAIVILTIGLGIGANVAIFSVVDGVLLRPLPYETPDRLVLAYENDRLRGTTQEGFSGPDYFDLVERNRTFASLAAFQFPSFTLTGQDAEPQRVAGASATYEMFPILGASAQLGRVFDEREDVPGGPSVVVISHGLWQTRFGGRASVLEQSLILNGTSYRIIGVMPAGFDFPSPTVDLWMPRQMGPTTTSRGNHGFNVIGRLADGVSLEQANAELTQIAAALEVEYADDNLGRGMWAESLYDAVVGDVRPALYVLLAAVGLVLLVACVNVANLLFARASVREREVAVRVALGAGRARLLKQFLTESVVLAGVGGAAGIGVAYAGVAFLLQLAPEGLPRLSNVGIDLGILGVAALISLGTGLVFGLVPALAASRPDLTSPMREGGRGGAEGSFKHRLRRGLVVVEIALAVVLVTGAGLLIRSFVRLQQVNPGFDPSDMLAVTIQLPASRYPQTFSEFPDWPEVRRFQTDLVDRMARIPGVVNAALALISPTNAGWTTRFVIEGRPEVPEGERDEIRIRAVSPAYFRTVGVPIVRGRTFTDFDDRPDAPAVLLINEAAARRYFTDEDPIGQRISIWGATREVIGVVGDVRFSGVDQETPPAVYPALSHMPFGAFTLLLRMAPETADLASAVRVEVRAMDADLALNSVYTLESALDDAVSRPRFNTLLLSTFAGLALTLAAIGVYGVMSFMVSRRRREIGVRISLGAARQAVIGHILGQGMRLVAVGVAIGLAGALALSRLLSSLLFGVGAFDPPTFIGVATVAAAVALIASAVPAIRASRVNPVEALRYD
jgi:predicted permease